jgi:hypothetical protein
MTADLTITRSSMHGGPNATITIVIRFGDEATIVEVTPADLALALTGIARVPVTIAGRRGPEVSPGRPAAPAGRPATVLDLRVPGERRILHVGDIVDVKPSRPRKRDGWRGTITTMREDGEVTVTCPGQSARTVRVERIGARKATTNPGGQQ